MGMDSKKLSQRSKQPGHDRTFVGSETSFIGLLRRILNPELFTVVEKPRDLCNLFPYKREGGKQSAYGVIPEASVICKATGRKLYFEVKNQGPRGNAEERACKHHTVQFQKTLAKFTGYDYHSFITIMCGSLAKDVRYTAKHPYFFEPDRYFCWQDFTDTDDFVIFLERVIRETIIDDPRASVMIPI